MERTSGGGGGTLALLHACEKQDKVIGVHQTIYIIIFITADDVSCLFCFVRMLLFGK